MNGFRRLYRPAPHTATPSAHAKTIALFSAALLAVALSAHAQPASTHPTVLLTLEWPPYTGLKLPNNGATSDLVRRVYAQQHEEVRIGFFSWRRAVKLPATDKRFSGYFPVYPSAMRQAACHLSNAIGSSPVGLAQLRTKPVKWAQIEDLTPHKIGVVAAYVNQERFDELVLAKRIKTLVSDTDTSNLLNLIQGRVSAAVIDQNVLAWLLNHDERLRAYKNRIELNEHLLTTWPLLVCFRKDPDGATLRDRFNASLTSLETPATNPTKK